MSFTPERAMRRWQLVRCEDVSVDFTIRRIKLTLSPGDEPTGTTSQLRAEHLDAALEEDAEGGQHRLVLRSTGEEEEEEEEEERRRDILYEHACGFLADVDVTKIKLKRNKVCVCVCACARVSC